MITYISKVNSSLTLADHNVTLYTELCNGFNKTALNN